MFIFDILEILTIKKKTNTYNTLKNTNRLISFNNKYLLDSNSDAIKTK